MIHSYIIILLNNLIYNEYKYLKFDIYKKKLLNNNKKKLINYAFNILVIV